MEGDCLGWEKSLSEAKGQEKPEIVGFPPDTDSLCSEIGRHLQKLFSVSV